MSFAVSAALQQAVFAQLVGDAGLQALVGGHIYDALPPGALPDLYVSLGPEDVRAAGAADVQGARHDFTVSVVSSVPGFASAKAAAGAVSDALVGASLPLARGHCVGIWFLRAKAARSGTNDMRRIDLRFRARVDDI